MKSLKLINGSEKYITDEEAENIKKAAETNKFIKLRDGAFINVNSISLIDEVETIPHWSVYPVYETKQGKYIIRDGEQCYLSPENIKEITYELPEELRKNPGMLRIMEREKPVLSGGMQMGSELQPGSER